MFLYSRIKFTLNIEKRWERVHFYRTLKAFAMKGNVIDMAVGVVIGGAFGKIVSSLVANVIMPPIGLLVGGVNFTDLKWVMKAAEIGADGKEIAPAVTLDYGQFLQATFDFLIIAFAIFLFIRLITKLTTKNRQKWRLLLQLLLCQRRKKFC